jgi:hypothetical protein
LHLGPLFVGQRTGLEKDLLPDADLADVVEDGAIANGLDVITGQPRQARQGECSLGDTAAVVLRRRILGVDGVREGDEDVLCGFQTSQCR